MGQESKKLESGKPGKWIRWVLGVLMVGIILIAAAPMIIANTPIRNRLIGGLVEHKKVTVTSEQASIGYFSPLSIGGLKIEANDGLTLIQFPKIVAQKSWLAMLRERPELGSFRFVEPAFDVTVAQAAQPPNDSSPTDESPENTAPAPPATAAQPLPVLTAIIEDASIVVREQGTKTPSVDLENLNVTFHLEREGQGSVVIIDPITVFDHQELTHEVCNQGMQLVAPFMATQLNAEGDFSFHLKQLKIPVSGGDPLEQSNQVEMLGVIQLHTASVALNPSVTSRLVNTFSKLMEIDVPERLHVINETQVSFHVAEGRVHHEGFAMVLPHRDSSIEIRTSGSVGLDNSLDVEVEIALPSDSLGQSELAKHLVEKPIVIQVTGTLETPVIELERDKDWTRRVEEMLATENIDEQAGKLAGRTTELLGELMQKRADREGGLFSGRRNDEGAQSEKKSRFRDRRDRRREDRERN